MSVFSDEAIEMLNDPETWHQAASLMAQIVTVGKMTGGKGKPGPIRMIRESLYGKQNPTECIVDDPGDTNFTPGQKVLITELDRANREAERNGEHTATNKDLPNHGGRLQEEHLIELAKRSGVNISNEVIEAFIDTKVPRWSAQSSASLKGVLKKYGSKEALLAAVQAMD